MTLAAVTIAARHQLVQARALARSLSELDPPVALHVLVLDDRRSVVDAAQEPFEVVAPDALDIARFEMLAGIHDLPELVEVVRPAVLRHVLDRAGGPVVSLGVDTLAFGGLRELADVAAHASVTLVPRLQAPVPRDHLRLEDTEVIAEGIFDRELLTVSPGDETDHLLRMWSDRLELDDSEQRPLAAARYLDLAPGMLPGCAIVRDPGLGVSAVNLHERAISHDRGFLVNGGPLRLVHFDGLHPDTPGVNAALLDEHDRLLARERERLLARDGLEPGYIDYGYAALADGTPLTPRLRAWIHDAELHGGFTGSPFGPEGTTALLQWLNGPAREGARWGVTRFWFGIYLERPDLRVIHPDLDGSGGPGYLRWAQETGAGEYAAPLSLMPTGVLS